MCIRDRLKDLFGDEFVDFNLVFCSSNGKPIEGQVINRAFNKLIEEKEPMAEEYLVDDAEYVVVAYGASARIAKAAVRQAREEGVKVGLIRPITLWPFPKKTLQKAADHTKAFLCVEMSMGQMVDDVRLAVNCAVPVSFFGRTGGIIPTPAEVLAEIHKLTGGNQ